MKKYLSLVLGLCLLSQVSPVNVAGMNGCTGKPSESFSGKSEESRTGRATMESFYQVYFRLFTYLRLEESVLLLNPTTLSDSCTSPEGGVRKTFETDVVTTMMENTGTRRQLVNRLVYELNQKGIWARPIYVISAGHRYNVATLYKVEDKYYVADLCEDIQNKNSPWASVFPPCMSSHSSVSCYINRMKDELRDVNANFYVLNDYPGHMSEGELNIERDFRDLNEFSEFHHE